MLEMTYLVQGKFSLTSSKFALPVSQMKSRSRIRKAKTSVVSTHVSHGAMKNSADGIMAEEGKMYWMPVPKPESDPQTRTTLCPVKCPMAPLLPTQTQI